jgi:uncharacterized OB-fold protein
MSEALMAKALNDTLGVKRAIKHFDFSEPYWKGTKQKKLVIHYCKATGKYQHFPRPVSIFLTVKVSLSMWPVSRITRLHSPPIAPPANAGRALL